MSNTAGDIDFNKVDMATLSNYSEVVTEHLHFIWNINLKKKTLSGFVQLKMKVIADGVKVIDLDSSKVEVKGVKVNGNDCNFKIADAYKALGNKLTITVPAQMQKKDTALTVDIAYSVGVNSSAMQWLDASSTKGGKHPYLFTQCEAIHARSMFPCQDTPAVKATYTAFVTAPEWCTVLMSALADDSLIPSSSKGKKGVFGWRQPVPIPSYLVAVAAGQLASKDISPRVRVWSEPEMVEAVAFEFSQTEEFLKAAEDLTLPYQWGRYDVLCLPPSFPYGGMENPCLTFATPTLLAGDRSLADVIAHEIAHSWTGNLVTNATWEHFWLNEGWTVWLERKIISRVKGSAEHLKLSATAGWKTLTDAVAGFGEDSEYTKLVRAPTDGDPDDAFSSVPYEKGFNLLYYLETVVGTDTFENFAKSYIAKFQRVTVTSGEFREHFIAFVTSNGTAAQKAQVAAVDWDQLFHAAGMPAHTPDFTTPLVSAAVDLSKKWIEVSDADISTANGFDEANIAGWSTQQANIFLDALLKHAGSVSPLSAAKLAQIDALYNYNSTENNEIKFRWQCLCLSTGVDWIVPKVVEFLKAQGRMKYVRPLYKALNACSAVNGTYVAKTTFIQFNGIYHPIARKMLASDLNVTEEELRVASAKPAASCVSSSSSSKTTLTKSCSKCSSTHLCSILFSSWPRVLATSGVLAGIAAFAWFVVNKNSKKASK